MSLYWPDLKDKVAGLVLAQSPYGGSPIATDILREGQLGDYVNLRKLMEILICKVIKVYDESACTCVCVCECELYGVPVFFFSNGNLFHCPRLRFIFSVKSFSFCPCFGCTCICDLC